MTLIEDDDMVEALAADRADETLHVGRLPGRAWSNAYLLDTEAAHSPPGPLAIDGIAVAQRVPGGQCQMGNPRPFAGWSTGRSGSRIR